MTDTARTTARTGYAPGTVALIGWRMTNGRERAIFNGESWMTESGIDVNEVTDIRPLVVLDVDYRPETRDELLGLLRAHCFTSTADQIEAQTGSSRIDEPGLWGVVEASWDSKEPAGIPRAEWMHVKGNQWLSCISNVSVRWDDLIDPTLIREGVAS